MKQNNKNTIQNENKKNLPKFILTLLISVIVGGLIGFSLAFFDAESLQESLGSAGTVFAVQAAPWLLCVCPLLDLVLCLPVYYRAKKRLERWDGENETESNAIDHQLSICLWVSSILLVLSFFLLSASFSGFFDAKNWLFLVGVGMFFLMLIVTVVLQKCVIDTTKQLYPEKKGSVYDMKFQKTWLESCDEAERAIIGQCALKSYSAVSHTCLVLWALLTIGGITFDIGFLPSLAVCVIWGVSQSVYFYWAMKLPNPSTSAPL